MRGRPDFLAVVVFFIGAFVVVRGLLETAIVVTFSLVGTQWVTPGTAAMSVAQGSMVIISAVMLHSTFYHTVWDDPRRKRYAPFQAASLFVGVSILLLAG